MTELLCHTDSYLKKFTAKVVSVNAETRSLFLDRTAFYPTGGGQPHDTGWRFTVGWQRSHRRN